MDKEKLQELVNTSSSLGEILQKQGKSISGASIKLLRQELEIYGISYHFLNEKEVKRKLDLSEILVKDKVYKSSDLRRRLVEEGIKEDKCERCGISEWQGEKLTLQLHHINGDHNDNRLENLQILCPNCHSLTDNFVNKRKDVKVCPDCGCKIDRRSEYCRKCSPKHKNSSTHKVPLDNRPSKEELLEMLKTMSFVDIGKKYGVCDNSIRKWCKNYGLPSTKKELREMMQ